jgi:hypothetical protein
MTLPEMDSANPTPESAEATAAMAAKRRTLEPVEITC